MFTRKRSISRVRVLPPGNPTNNYPPSLQLPRSQHGARSRRRGVTIPRRVTQLGPQYGQYSDGDTGSAGHLASSTSLTLFLCPAEVDSKELFTK